jgi:hypothetical protein
MAKSKKVAQSEDKVEVVTAETSVETPAVEEVGPSITELVEKMKKEGKSYVRIKKLF